MATDLMRRKRRDINIHRREAAEQERADAIAREKEQAEKDRIIYEDKRESFFTPVSSDNLATGSASNKKRRGSVFGNISETVLGN